MEIFQHRFLISEKPKAAVLAFVALPFNLQALPCYLPILPLTNATFTRSMLPGLACVAVENFFIFTDFLIAVNTEEDHDAAVMIRVRYVIAEHFLTTK